MNTCMPTNSMRDMNMDQNRNMQHMDCSRERTMDRTTGINCFNPDRDRERFPLGMAYVPMQKSLMMYDNLQKAYCAGTIFPSLDKPFTGRRCVR